MPVARPRFRLQIFNLSRRYLIRRPTYRVYSDQKSKTRESDSRRIWKRIATAAGKASRLLQLTAINRKIFETRHIFHTTVLLPHLLYFQSLSFDSISGSGIFFQVHYIAVCIVLIIYCAYGGPLNGLENRRVSINLKPRRASCGHSTARYHLPTSTHILSTTASLSPLPLSHQSSYRPDRHSSLSASRSRVIATVYIEYRRTDNSIIFLHVSQL